jgi:O-antigen/teichoic acid export membrane protein
VDEIILQLLIDKRYPRVDVLKSVLVLRLMMSLIAFLILGFFLYFFKSEDSAFSLLIFFYGIQIFIQAFNLFELDFQSQLEFKPLFWANNISNIFGAGLRVIGIWLSMSVPYFISTYLAGDILLKSIVQWRLGFKALKGRFDPNIVNRLAKSSWPFFLAAFVIVLDQRISFMFIEELLTGEELGNYSVSVTLIDLWAFLPAAVCSAFFPTIVSVFKVNQAAFENRIQYLADMMVWMSFLLILGVHLFADVALELLYGYHYSKAVGFIKLYSFVTLPMFFNFARIKWMSLENQLFDWLKLSVFSLVLNFTFHKYLVPLHGVQGAILSYLLSQLIVNAIGGLLMDSSRYSLRIFLRTITFPIRMIQKLN